MSSEQVGRKSTSVIAQHGTLGSTNHGTDNQPSTDNHKSSPTDVSNLVTQHATADPTGQGTNNQPSADNPEYNSTDTTQLVTRAGTPHLGTNPNSQLIGDTEDETSVRKEVTKGQEARQENGNEENKDNNAKSGKTAAKLKGSKSCCLL